MLIFPLKIIHQNKDSFEQSILIISHVHLALQLLTLSPSQISLIVSDIFTVCSSFCLYINPFCDNIIERCYDSNKCRNYPDIKVVLSLFGAYLQTEHKEKTPVIIPVFILFFNVQACDITIYVKFITSFHHNKPNPHNTAKEPKQLVYFYLHLVKLAYLNVKVLEQTTTKKK